ncbi:MAG: ATP-binding protein [Anaerolineae bacterium]|nr:ATP-binding protein [Anaerolineae bacterium]MDW8068176.1 ATP-binding protein [Anaerolineae bacterium]
MRSLFWKGMLAFLAVVGVAIGGVALLVGWTTEQEFRRYALARGGMWERVSLALAEYYAVYGSWDGLQERLALFPRPPMMRRGMTPPGVLDFRVADASGRIVGDTRGDPRGTATRRELQTGIQILLNGEIVGYILPNLALIRPLPLNPEQLTFLSRVRTALLVATLTALAMALVVGGVLFRSIIHPLQQLTAASQAIARGDLSVRAPVRGNDEVAQLARAFNGMAESLARAQEARRNQTADLAHELRTPLTVLQGTLEAMVDGVYPADRENLLAALAQVRILSRLVEDLRLLSLADAGELTLHRGPLDLGRFLEEVVEAHRPTAQERSVSLSLERPASLPLVLADRDRLAQVMGNLLTNALRYTPPEGRITVRVADRGREVMVAVADTGPGVPPEDLPHLFERFWRRDPSRQRATGGSGLGLSIARHIVEAHGGHIWAEPTPGGGLTVAFALPTAVIA